jgi:hypothetical protein
MSGNTNRSRGSFVPYGQVSKELGAKAMLFNFIVENWKKMFLR